MDEWPPDPDDGCDGDWLASDEAFDRSERGRFFELVGEARESGLYRDPLSGSDGPI